MRHLSLEDIQEGLRRTQERKRAQEALEEKILTSVKPEIDRAFGSAPESFAAFDEVNDNLFQGLSLSRSGQLHIMVWKSGQQINTRTMKREEVEAKFRMEHWQYLDREEMSACIQAGHLTPRALAYQRQRAKSLVRLCFRNGPIEEVHSRGGISDEDMKLIMTDAVNKVFTFLKDERMFTAIGGTNTHHYDDPRMDKDLQLALIELMKMAKNRDPE